MNRLLMLGVLLASVGCSNKAIYDNLQLYQRNECGKQPTPLYFDCLERTRKTYEEYERERQSVLE